MSSLILRDQLITQCWVPADFRAPPSHPEGDHYPVEVWGVVDPTSLPDGVCDKRAPFADVVVYWPALRRWTSTFTIRGAEEAEDHYIRVLYWQPLPPVRM